MKLFFKALIKLLGGMAAIALLLFLPAGTYLYPNGLLFCALLFIPMLIVGVLLFIKDKTLLEKRLNSNEKEDAQKVVLLVSTLEFIGCFITAGLDFRYGWTHVPTAVVIIASVLFICAYLLYAEVMRENAYLSRTVEVQENQKVVSTGLYGIVRHPMYMATWLLFTMMPIVLGSWIALLFMIPLPFILAKRIHNEEEVLKAGLDGYAEYVKKVKYRMIPFIW
ncbi:MAG: isoprenylcysteine carboxylmethyltransferase family protein [Eubacteriales bacterium]|nr:isoprenylcysteine carboxylmethyltransferase family protein [Eubacteriales bacterium]